MISDYVQVVSFCQAVFKQKACVLDSSAFLTHTYIHTHLCSVCKSFQRAMFVTLREPQQGFTHCQLWHIPSSTLALQLNYFCVRKHRL